MVQQDDEELRVEISQAERDLSSCRHVGSKVDRLLEGRSRGKKSWRTRLKCVGRQGREWAKT